ncbi:hypothetical protein [Desulfosarcina widdelii]|nr:hypothetical protein [Desulfosarcina widdelii]
MRETPKTFRCGSIVGCILLLAVFGGCAGLPDYALPRSGVTMADPAMIDEAFTYRQLTRSDFRAPALPADQDAHATAINAHTCARIRPTKDSRFSVVRTRYNDSVVFIGGIEKIRFEGIMIPGCSWWNPALPAGSQAYVLQHEQIHFALVELAARRLTVDIREEAQSFMTVQPTAEAARTEIATTVNRWIRSAMEASLEMHTAFDNDTSLFHSPRWQQWWQDKIEKQLAADPEPTGKK